jgi:CheY-like chemotaxis protein
MTERTFPILVAEDNPEERKLMRLALQRAGVRGRVDLYPTATKR